MTESESTPELDPVLQVLRTAFIFGTATFAAGFVFGVIREVALIPLLGRSAGKALEFIIMLGMTFVTAVFALRHLKARSKGTLLAAGLLGVAVLLGFESAFALYVMDVPLAVYLQGFNLMKGELFPFGLAVMALAPILFERFRMRT